ncbi:MAG: HD domain-containing protein, partial [Spirochaetia bacterium]|nr:HD domain-containing protein [Spirochaetia bacterium]
IPGHVREKNSALSEQERGTVKTHPLLGYQLLLKNGKVKAGIATVALQHHEAFDGSGYPQGLRAGQVEETARIAAIADCYTAMIEPRPFRNAHLPYDAMKHMLSVQMNRFDPRLLRAFLGRLSIYPTGSIVQLSNGRVGLVLACRADKPLRPLLRILRDDKALPMSGMVLSDLLYDTDVYIVKAVDPVSVNVDMDVEI